MALHVQGSNVATAWKRLLNQLLGDGQETAPRGMLTREILNVTFEVENGLDNILVFPTRDLNYRFMVAEWLWILAGLDDVNVLASYNSVMRKFSDDGHILSGAYGPRIMPQMPYILGSLIKTDTRQAVATIWTPSPKDSKDIPCTISLQWLIRNQHLHCTVNMRSSDVWLGLPYDYFTFSQITNYVASCLGLKVGSITMNLASSHIYEPNFEIGYETLKDCDYEWVSSPSLSSEPIACPKSQDISAMLWKQEDMYKHLGKPWTDYGRSLVGNKAYCLEVLRAISSK